MARPILLIDVDGVLAPFGWREPLPGFEAHVVEDEPDVFLRAADGDRLRALAERFELVWCTSRDDAAERIAVGLGLPDLEVLDFSIDSLDSAHRRWALADQAALEGGSAERTWKLPWVDQRCTGRAVAWIDDDLRADAHAWAEHRASPTLLVEPDPRVGVTEEHWAALERLA